MSLHDRLKKVFRDFEHSDRGIEYKHQQWYPEASDLADVMLEFLRTDDGLLMDLILLDSQ